MLKEQNKALLRQYVTEVWDNQNLAAIDQFLAANYRRHRGLAGAPLTLEEQKQRLADFRAAVPDAELSLEDIVADGDRVAFRSTIRGTHRGEFLGIAPSGRKVTVALLDIIRIEDGKFVEQWGGPDMLSLLQQLGALVSAQVGRK